MSACSSGSRVADGVGHVDRGGALVERDLQHLGGELEVRAGRVHGRELDVLAVAARLGHRRARLALHVLAGRLQLVLDVDVARRDEGVDARALRVLDGVPGGVDVLSVCAGEPGDHGAVHLAGDRLDGLEVAGRGDREAGLDDVDAEPRELVRDLELLLLVQRDPRRLLPVAQGGVEDLYSVVLAAVHVASRPFPVGPTGFSLSSRLPAGATRYSPRGGEEGGEAERRPDATCAAQRTTASTRPCRCSCARGCSDAPRGRRPAGTPAPRPDGCGPRRARRAAAR